jgi:hypothetical protein
MPKCTNVKLIVRLSNRLTTNSAYGTFLVQSLSKGSASKSLPSVISSLHSNRLAIMNRLLLLSLSSNRSPLLRMQLDNAHLLTGVLIQIKGKAISRTPKVRTSSKQIRIGSTSHKTLGVSTSHYNVVLLTQVGTIEVALTKAYTLLNHVDPVAHRL